MKKACVIGWPIAHSRSPLIHGYWLKKYGLEGSYTKEAVKPEDLEAFLSSLAAHGFAGCNVTVPHKEAAFARADVKHTSAEAVGAANTLWLEAGKLHAANTDTYGFMSHLNREAPQWQHGDRPVAVLGAGGAARAIVYGFLEAGVQEVRVFNRSAGHVEELARHFGPRVRALGWDAFSQQTRDAGVILNATTVGMKGHGDIELDLAQVSTDCVVADIVYVPLETGLLRKARARGLKTVDGLGMLLHQAVPGFQKWFGIKPEVTPELRAIVEADIAGNS